MRDPWDKYFLDIANLVKTRSTCLRRQVGAVLVKDNRIISTGYNGAPSGSDHCDKLECLRKNIPSGERHELCRAIHAEQNAIIQSAKYGVSTFDTTIYVTCKPCIICAKMIVSSGIVRVVFIGDYPDPNSTDLLLNSGVSIVKYEECDQS